ncbi:hypothetical protein EDD85DRAFT_795040 [Armillaria nabsnona]|nr:hypothetical protein EDD85DRAFT_795040 [Armillaria nabsnona]
MGKMEDSKPNPQDFHMVQADETLFELEEISNCIAQIEVNGKEIQEFQFVWLVADSMYDIIGDSDHPVAERVSKAFKIFTEAFHTNFSRLYYLGPSQYKVFQSLMKTVEDVLSNMELSDTIKGDCLPQWGTENNVTEWITLSDLELFAICFHIETKHCLSMMLEYHDWETGQPRDQHEENDLFLPKTRCMASRQPTISFANTPAFWNGQQLHTSFADI